MNISIRIKFVNIYSHRIEHSIDDILYMPNCERAICEKIMQVVIVHRRALVLVYSFSISVKSIGFLLLVF